MVSVLLVVITLFTLCMGAGMMNGLFRLYFETKGIERKELAGATWLWYLVVAGLGCIVLLTLAPGFSQLLFHTRDYAGPFRATGAVFFFSMMHSVPFSILRLEKRAGLYVGLSLFNFLVDFVLKLCFIVILGRGINGYFESSALAHMATLGLISPLVLRYVRLRPKLHFYGQLLRLGVPYIFNGLALWTLEVSDKLLLTHFSGEAAVGIYSLAYNFARVFQVLLSGPAFLLMDPFFFGYAAERPAADTQRLLERTLVYFFLAGGVLYLAIALGTPEILRLLVTGFGARAQYLDAAALVPILALVPFIYFLTSQAILGGLLAKKPEISTVAFVIAAGANVGLNLIVIPRFGAHGAAVDGVAAYLLLIGVLYWQTHRVYQAAYDWKGIVLGTGCLAVAFGVGQQISLASPLLSFFIRLLVGTTLFLLLVMFVGGLLTRREKEKLLDYIISAGARVAAGLVRRS